ncbi:MAG: hypothetical protein IK099_16480 [Clostridia bacterium]|nr:hypothetical protein [Clostridia bacterium]
MKKITALILAVVLLCSCIPALAAAVPGVDTFAGMKVKTKGDKVTVTLTKPVDKLYANWPSEYELVELAVSSDLTASVLTTRHSYQLGVVYNELAPWLYYACVDDWNRAMGTKYDRAFVTLQGDWIVSYNRKGEVVDIAAATAKDIYTLRAYAFQR